MFCLSVLNSAPKLGLKLRKKLFYIADKDKSPSDIDRKDFLGSVPPISLRPRKKTFTLRVG